MELNAHGQPVGPAVPGWVPPPVPAADLELVGEDVRLVAMGGEDLATYVPGLYAATCGPGSEAAWTYMSAGPFEDEAGLTAYLKPMVTGPDWLPLVVLDRGSQRVLGMAAYLRIAPATGSIEVGALMFGPDLARTRGATEAMWLMARYAFGLGYRRYEWKCDSLNAPSRRAAARLGFVEEGTFRQAVVYKGRNRDTTWFSITDDEWPRVQEAQRRWLADAVAGAPGRLAGYYRD